MNDFKLPETLNLLLSMVIWDIEKDDFAIKEGADETNSSRSDSVFNWVSIFCLKTIFPFTINWASFLL